MKKEIQKELALRIKGIRPGVETTTDFAIGELKSALMMVDCLPDDEPERKYKDALAWMREVYPTLTGAAKEDAMHYFPELRESEDERMMREFNDWLCEEIECRTNDLRDEKDRRTLNMLCFVLTKVKEWLEKQKEQKPVEKQDYSGLNDLERAIHRGFLCAGVENVPVAIIKETANDCLTHLPVEWSEEDEEMRNLLVAILEVNHPDGFFKANEIGTTDMRGFHTEEIISWLKSPRHGWKPTEEQMKALQCAIVFIEIRKASDYDISPLKSLYEQLKKLM